MTERTLRTRGDELRTTAASLRAILNGLDQLLAVIDDGHTNAREVADLGKYVDALKFRADQLERQWASIDLYIATTAEAA